MQQALLNNDAKLAEIALQQLEKSYALALEGFEYKTTLQNNRLTYIQNINDTYFSKTNTLQNRLDDYNDKINSVKSAQEQAKLQAAASRSSSSRSSGGSGGSYTFTETPVQQQTPTQTTSSTNLAGLGLAALQAAATTPKNTTYTAKNNPKLSGKNASSWYASNISGKSFTANELKSILDKAWEAGKITSADRMNIKASFGVK